MARHYSARDFFRQMSNGLLARYFQAQGLFGDLDFVTMIFGFFVLTATIFRHFPMMSRPGEFHSQPLITDDR